MEGPPAHMRSATEHTNLLLRRGSSSKQGHLQTERSRAMAKLEDEVERLSKSCRAHEQRIRASLARLQTTLYVTFPNELAALDELDVTAEETSAAMLMASSSSLPAFEARLRAARDKADKALSAFDEALGSDDARSDIKTRVDAVKEQLVKEKQAFEHSMRFKTRLRRALWYSFYALLVVICVLMLVGYLSRG